MKALHLAVLIIFFSSSLLAGADTVKNILVEGDERLSDNQTSQQTIDKISSDTQDIVADFHEKLKIVDGLRVYNALLNKQLENQDKEIETLRRSIADAAVIERQILPMLSRMVEGVDTFIDLDVPFLLDERKKRVANLENIMIASNVSNAEKTRRVFEAFQIENDYGNTIEAYKGKLNLSDSTYDVDFLRVGRIAFLYRTVGGEKYGFWDIAEKEWKPIEESQFIRNIDKGIKIARQEMAPELMVIPVKNTLGGI